MHTLIVATKAERHIVLHYDDPAVARAAYQEVHVKTFESQEDSSITLKSDGSCATFWASAVESVSLIDIEAQALREAQVQKIEADATILLERGFQ